MARHERCGDYKEALSAYLDGELSSAERIELLQHLSSCPDCRETLNEYRSIGSQLRGMPPLIVPEELTSSVYELTVDAPPRRLSLLSSRFGYPAAAAAAVLLIFVVATFLLVDGYRRGIDPAIEGSSPITGVQWSINDPIRITFNKEMDRESVEAALTIQPTSERDLALTWEDNTLTIGGNRPLKPGSSYKVTVTTEARDKWGNRLSEPFTLAFATSSTLRAYETPVPVDEPEPTVTSTPDAGIAQDEPPTSTPEPPQATATRDTSDSVSGGSPTQTTVPQPTNTPEPPPAGDGDGNAEEPGQQEQPAPPPTETPAPEPTETPVPPTATPEPEPTEEPTQVPPTETPEPTATPEPEPTEEPATPTTEPEPEPTVTPDTIPVVGSFGSVYWRNELVRNELGQATTEEHGISAVELDFQRGKMFQDLSTGVIYMMLTEDGTWSYVQDTSGGELPSFTEADEVGTWEPGGVFGYLWHEEPYVQETLGYSVESAAHTFESSTQTFEGGTMLRGADGFIYILYDGGRWELYPDAGPLSDVETESAP